MPSVNVAMERSLREGAIDLLAASIRPLLDRRAGTITESVSDVKTAFSSWDNCMKFTYCKYGSPRLRPLHLVPCLESRH